MMKKNSFSFRNVTVQPRIDANISHTCFNDWIVFSLSRSYSSGVLILPNELQTHHCIYIIGNVTISCMSQLTWNFAKYSSRLIVEHVHSAWRQPSSIPSPSYQFYSSVTFTPCLQRSSTLHANYKTISPAMMMDSKGILITMEIQINTHPFNVHPSPPLLIRKMGIKNYFLYQNSQLVSILFFAASLTAFMLPFLTNFKLRKNLGST